VKNSIVLEKPMPAPQRNAVSPKSVIAGHGVASQQRRSPGNYLDKQDHIEGMTEGTTRRIRDLRAGRVAILICEDHGRMIQEAANLAEHGPSLIFVPIFSEPIRQYRWEYNAAADHVLALGASVVVSNSCAVPVPADTVDNFVKKGVVYGTSLAAWPKEDAFGYSAVNVQITPFDPDPEKVSYFQVPLT
jgi:predicted amidohydrolase